MAVCVLIDFIDLYGYYIYDTNGVKMKSVIDEVMFIVNGG